MDGTTGSGRWPASVRRLTAATLLLASGAAATACGERVPEQRIALEPLFVSEAVADLGGRPFVVSPDGRFLAFSVAEAPEDAGASLEVLGRRDLEAVRILDPATGDVRAPSVEPAAADLLEGGHAPVPTLRCWDPSGGVLYVGTTGRRWLELDVRGSELGWRLMEQGRPSPTCSFREVARTPYQTGDFEIAATDGGGLRVDHSPDGRTLFQSEPPLLREHLLRHATAAPGGRRLVLLFSSALGSFTGPDRSLLLTLGPSGDVQLRELEPALLFAAWGPDGDVLYGYGRLPDRPHSGVLRARPGS